MGTNISITAAATSTSTKTAEMRVTIAMANGKKKKKRHAGNSINVPVWDEHSVPTLACTGYRRVVLSIREGADLAISTHTAVESHQTHKRTHVTNTRHGAADRYKLVNHVGLDVAHSHELIESHHTRLHSRLRNRYPQPITGDVAANGEAGKHCRGLVAQTGGKLRDRDVALEGAAVECEAADEAHLWSVD